MLIGMDLVFLIIKGMQKENLTMQGKLENLKKIGNERGSSIGDGPLSKGKMYIME